MTVISHRLRTVLELTRDSNIIHSAIWKRINAARSADGCVNSTKVSALTLLCKEMRWWRRVPFKTAALERGEMMETCSCPNSKHWFTTSCRKAMLGVWFPPRQLLWKKVWWWRRVPVNCSAKRRDDGDGFETIALDRGVMMQTCSCLKTNCSGKRWIDRHVTVKTTALERGVTMETDYCHV